MSNIMEDGLYSWLTATAAVTNIFGTNIFERVFPQNSDRPALAYDVISDVVLVTHDQKQGPGETRIQLDLEFDDTDIAALKAAENTLKDLLVGFRGTMGTIEVHGVFFEGRTEQPITDPTLKLRKVALDFMFHFKR